MINLIKKLLVPIFLSVQGYAVADTVYVTLEKDNAVAVVDGITGKLNQVVEVGLRPRGIILSKDKTQLYVAVSDENTIKRIDIASMKIVGAIPVDKDPKTFAMSPNGDRLYVTNDDDNQLTVIDIPQNKICGGKLI